MINAVLRFSLQNRLLVIVVALGVMIYGGMTAVRLPIDVLPDLTRPRVVIITECPGLAPEEVESLVTIPIESAVNGASGVQFVRSSSDVGLSVIYVEFDWSQDIYLARQIVQERMATTLKDLPDGITPELGPVSSLLGQIVMVGLWSETGETDPLELRTVGDWVVRKRLLSIPGVAQVITMGGGRMQFQVQINPHLLHKYEVSLADVEQALQGGNLNVTGGYLNDDARELQVRSLGRIHSLEQIEEIVVKFDSQRPVLVRDIADVKRAAQVKRGDSAVNGHDAVVITIQKQPGADTRFLTDEINRALAEVRTSLPADVRLESTYEQREFIDYSVANVIEAVRDGGILVVIILAIFLVNFRTTFITLTAIPLSILTTAFVFKWSGQSINIMTLGGIAVAMGELVDDAIVDVENIFSRLRENRKLEKPLPALQVVWEASMEVRGAIMMSTILVMLVFAPLFALSGMEGRLFTPLGIAYLVSIIASTLVSLTVTPVLSYLLLPNARVTGQEDGRFVQLLKALIRPVLRFSMSQTGFAFVCGFSLVAVLLSSLVIANMGKDFLPAFDEGAIQVNMFLPPGTSLEQSRKVSEVADQKFRSMLRTDEHPERPLLWFTCKTGRAENDEHVMGVNTSEYVMSLNPDAHYSRSGLIEKLHHELEDLPGVEVEVEQPIAHLISHMLSGVTAQIAIKVFGDDLAELRNAAKDIKDVISSIEGIAEPVIEQQTLVPQLQIQLLTDQLANYGLTAEVVQRNLETAMNGRVVTKLLVDQRTFDVLVRYEDLYRSDLNSLHRTPIELPDGRRIMLQDVAEIIRAAGPNTIKREDARRRIVVRVNTMGKDLVTAVKEIREKITTEVDLPTGYYVVYAGQHEAQASAMQRIVWLSLLSMIGVIVVLYATFPSFNLVFQILIAIPAAFVGGVIALVLTGQTLSVAGMVGFISLGGIAARNGILLISTYLSKIEEEGYVPEAIIAGNLDRLSPVLMTALTTGIGLIPLVIGGSLPGKEILFPVATVILGGLITSTLAEFLVRPGLFWFASKQTSQRLIAEKNSRSAGADSFSGTNPPVL